MHYESGTHCACDTVVNEICYTVNVYHQTNIYSHVENGTSTGCFGDGTPCTTIELDDDFGCHYPEEVPVWDPDAPTDTWATPTGGIPTFGVATETADMAPAADPPGTRSDTSLTNPTATPSGSMPAGARPPAEAMVETIQEVPAESLLTGAAPPPPDAGVETGDVLAPPATESGTTGVSPEAPGDLPGDQPGLGGDELGAGGFGTGAAPEPDAGTPVDGDPFPVASEDPSMAGPETQTDQLPTDELPTTVIAEEPDLDPVPPPVEEAPADYAPEPVTADAGAGNEDEG